MIGLLDLGLRRPVVGAPMAGGPSTPALAAAVGDAGGLGFLAGGYLTGAELEAQVAELRQRSGAPFGVNLFVPGGPTGRPDAVARYLATLAATAEGLGVDLGASWDDDHWDEKVDLLLRLRPAVASFTFGCPPPGLAARLAAGGTRVVVTVTTPGEARIAVAAGAHAVCAQGTEAGGHQGTFDDEQVGPDAAWGLLALVTAVRRAVDVPVLAAGGISAAGEVAAVLRAGAAAAVVGTALLRCPESGTNPVHRAALADPSFTSTALTRAFSGRRARGLVNDFMRAHPDAPSAYPEINNATGPLRRAAVARGDPHGTNLWAGQGFAAADDRPASDVVAALAADD